MLRPLALPSMAASVLALASALDALAKPCNGLTAVPALEEMLPRARVALDIPGTEQVAVDPARRCIGIQVRTQGNGAPGEAAAPRGRDSSRSGGPRVVEPVPAPPATLRTTAPSGP